MSPEAARTFSGQRDKMIIYNNYIFDLASEDQNNTIQAKATKKIV